MRLSDNFDLNLVEGSDVVNLLTQMNPNTEKIDEQMFKNQNAGVQSATELLTGTVHAITRSVPDASMIRFTAVSRFTAGDTFTVDGVQVSALLPSGEQLADGAFIIGSEVLCVLKGTLLTVFAGAGAVAMAQDSQKLGGELPEYYATKQEVDSALATATSAGSLAENAVTKSNLVETKLENYTQYVMSESVIGKWINGMDIYRMVLTGTLVVNQPLLYTFEEEVELISIEGSAKSSTNNSIMINSHTTGGNFTVYLASDNKKLMSEVGTAFVGKPYTIIVTYVKRV